MGHVQAVRVVLAMLVSTAVVTGCGGEEKPAAQGTGATAELRRTGPVPEGWKVSATPAFSYAHPGEWTVDVRPGKSGAPGEVVSEARGPEMTKGLPPDVVVAATPKYQGTLEGLITVNTTDAQVRFPKRKLIRESRPDIPGAQGARLIEADIENPLADGTTVTVRQFDLVSLSKEGTAVSMFIQLPAGEVDAARVRDILSTLEIR